MWAANAVAHVCHAVLALEDSDPLELKALRIEAVAQPAALSWHGLRAGCLAVIVLSGTGWARSGVQGRLVGELYRQAAD